MQGTKVESTAIADFEKNRVTLTFKGVVTAKEMNKLYTDVRFAVADLEEKYNVVSDFTECKFMYLNSLGTFKKIYNYMLSNKSGEMIRVIHSKRIISKQILNYALHRPGYKPIYVSTREEAENKLSSATRDGLRFDLNEKPIAVINNSSTHEGFILNISTSGCAITSKTVKLKNGDEIQVKFKLNTQSKIEEFSFQARVVRVESYTFAVKFLNLNNLQRSLLWGCLVVESNADCKPAQYSK